MNKFDKELIVLAIQTAIMGGKEGPARIKKELDIDILSSLDQLKIEAPNEYKLLVPCLMVVCY